MNAATTSEPPLLRLLRKSSLFRIYGEAFKVATGYTLSLVGEGEEPGPGKLAVPVPIGRTSPLQLVAWVEDTDAFCGGESNDSLRGMLNAFARQLGEASNEAVLESSEAEPEVVKRAKAFMGERMQGKLHLDDIASVVGVSPCQLCRLFKGHAGMTMTEFMNRKRVERAKKGLRDPDRQVIEISEEVGSTSLSQFNRNFLKYTGETPTEYRLRLKQLEHCDLQFV